MVFWGAGASGKGLYVGARVFIFGYGKVVIFGHVAVHECTVVSFRHCYHVNL